MQLGEGDALATYFLNQSWYLGSNVIFFFYNISIMEVTCYRSSMKSIFLFDTNEQNIIFFFEEELI